MIRIVLDVDAQRWRWDLPDRPTARQYWRLLLTVTKRLHGALAHLLDMEAPRGT